MSNTPVLLPASWGFVEKQSAPTADWLGSFILGSRLNGGGGLPLSARNLSLARCSASFLHFFLSFFSHPGLGGSGVPGWNCPSTKFRSLSVMTQTTFGH